MTIKRHVRLFRNGRNQAVRIPREFELKGAAMHDLVIRGGNLVDGTGQPPRITDVGIDGPVITAVGNDVGAGRR